MSSASTRTQSFFLKLVVVFVGSLILTASAKISVPFFPVPMTLQILAVLLIAFLMPPALAFSTVALYILQGAVGLPVFTGTPAKGIGLAYMMGPTGGYILGFLIATALVSFLSLKTSLLTNPSPLRKFFSLIAISSLGVAAIYIPGILWLGSIIGWDKPILALGLYPFLPADALKIFLAALTVIATQRLILKKSN
jgi:biotin transport system substrate-specific component